MTLTGWAASRADGLLAPLGDRWAHVQGVVRQAQEIAVILPAEEREVLIAAAYCMAWATPPHLSLPNCTPSTAPAVSAAWDTSGWPG